MQKIRIVYKNHLVPPIIKPIYKLQQLLKYQNPQLSSFTIRQNIKVMNKNELKKIRNDVDNINKKIVEQNQQMTGPISSFFQKCPCYYQMLMNQIKKKTMKDIDPKKNIFQLLQQIEPFQKQQTYQKFKRFYNHKHKTIGKSLKLRLLPFLIHKSPQQLFKAQNQNLQWNGLSDYTRDQYQQRYKKKLKDYNQEMVMICLDENISLSTLLNLNKTQFTRKIQYKHLIFPI